MTKEQVITQLKSLIEDRESFIDSNDKDSIFKQDKEALECAIKILKEQDKIIDLMSEQLTTPIHSKEYVKEYYERKVKEILNR